MSDKIVTVATTMTPGEAHVVKNRLEEEGILTFLANEEMVGMAWYLGNAVGGVKVQVAEEDAVRAAALLARPGEPTPPDAADVAVEPSEDCGDDSLPVPAHDDADDETVELPGDAMAGRAFRASIFGLVVFPPLLHLYSLYVLQQLLQSGHELSPKGNRMCTWAAVIDAGVILLAAFVLGMIL